MKRQWTAHFNVVPTAKGRARQGKYGHFTPTKTRDAEAELKKLMLLTNAPMFSGPLIMRLTFHFKRPKSAKKRSHVTTRPDCDNLAKLFCDCGNGILYEDDKNIVELSISKQYSEEDGITVELAELE